MGCEGQMQLSLSHILIDYLYRDFMTILNNDGEKLFRLEMVSKTVNFC